MRFTKFLVIPLIFIVSMVFTMPLYAQEIVKNEVVTLPHGQTVNKDYFATGEKIIISGDINGDAYLFGGNVIVEGNINGDLIVAAGSINIVGNISQDVRAAGGDVLINGNVGGNVTAIAGSVSIPENTHLGGSLTTATGSLSAFAPITKGLTFAAGEATIGNTVGSDVKGASEKITLLSKSQINGDFTYLSRNQARIEQGAQITGKTTHNLPPAKDKGRNLAHALRAFEIISFISTLLLGAIILKLLPNFSSNVAAKILKLPVRTLLFGILIIIFTPILAVIFLISLVGIPISLLLILSLILYILFAKVFVSMAIGTKVLELRKTKFTPFRTFLVGLLVYTLIAMIPIIGHVLTVFTVFVAAGAIFLTKMDIFKSLHSKKLL